MYELYIGNKNYSSWSLRPWVLMRKLGIPFKEHVVTFEPVSSWSKFRAFSPSGKVPCLVDGDVVAWDSLAIAEYLAERHPAVWPTDPKARAWARCAAAEMHSGFTELRQHCSMNCGLRIRLRETPPAVQRDLDRMEELWSDGVARFGGPFLAGPAFTAVDAFFSPVAFRVQTYGLVLGVPAAAYVGRLLALPAMKEWMQAALVEPWRDEEHDIQARSVGTVLEDLREPTASH